MKSSLLYFASSTLHHMFYTLYAFYIPFTISLTDEIFTPAEAVKEWTHKNTELESSLKNALLTVLALVTTGKTLVLNWGDTFPSLPFLPLKRQSSRKPSGAFTLLFF